MTQAECRRGAVLFGGLGGGVGAVAGASVQPVVGTVAGTVLGAGAGAGFGVFLGLVLAHVARPTASVRRLRFLTASATGTAAAVLLAGSRLGTLPAVLVVVVTACAAATFAPMTVYGVRLPRGGDAGRAVRTILARTSMVGMLAGAVVGAIRGASYLPTLAVAVVEGGILGALAGLPVAWAVATIWLLPRLRSATPTD